jgi:hypothetical protein
MNKLIDIWFRLLITSLDILHYTIRLQYQRLKFTIEDTVRYYHNSEKVVSKYGNKPLRDKSHTTNTNTVYSNNSSFIFSGNESPKLEKASKDIPNSTDDGYRNTKPYCETP